MEKIKLSENQKRILKKINEGTYNDIPKSDYDDLNVLEVEKFLQCGKFEDGGYYIANITDRGKAYIKQNPKLKNPSIWDDKKYWITTGISLIAILISLVALYFSIIK